MSVIFYHPLNKNLAGDKLKKIIASSIAKDKIETYRTIDEFYERLQKPICHSSVAVLYAATKKDMGRLLHLREFLSGMKVVLILPDDSIDTIAEGHALSPRFISWADSDFSAIEAVLKRLIALSEDNLSQ